MESLSERLTALDMQEPRMSPELQTAAPHMRSQRLPARRSSWLMEVGGDNSRRHSTNLGQAPLQVPPPPISPPNRSHSFSAGQKNAFAGGGQDPAQKRYSSGFATVSESAIEDEYEVSTQSSESNSVLGATRSAGSFAGDHTHRQNQPHLNHLQTSFEPSAHANLGSLSPHLPSGFLGADVELAPKYYVVQFKLHRADVYKQERAFVPELRLGDLVMVEADRGIDLGKIISLRSSHVQALTIVSECQKQYHQELLSFSNKKYIDKDFEPPALKLIDQATSIERRSPHANSVRQILRRPGPDEVLRLKDKEHSEAKARRIAHNEAAKLGFDIEVLDAEFQFDFEKLTVSYYADYYIHFNNLVNALYKHYKTRIWMSNINQNATTQSAPHASLAAQPSPWRHGPLNNRDHIRYLSSALGIPEMQAHQMLLQAEHDNPAREAPRSMPSEPPPIPPNTVFYDWGQDASNKGFTYAKGVGGGSPIDQTHPGLSPRLGQPNPYRYSRPYDRNYVDPSQFSAFRPDLPPASDFTPTAFNAGRRYPIDPSLMPLAENRPSVWNPQWDATPSVRR